MPRRHQPDYSRATPSVPGLALEIYWTKGRTKGIAQHVNATLRRGIATASHQAAKPNLT
jgi:hypothetical protein